MSVKKCICALSIIAAGLAAAAAPARAERTGDLGIGIIAGEPFGLTAKHFFNDTLAVDGGFGYGNAAVFYGDLLFNFWGLQQPSSGKLDLYAGAGPRLATDDGGQFAVRTIAGLGYWPSGHPVELFAEFGPTWKISPDDGRIGLDGGVGFRYYFTLTVARESPR